MIVKTQPAGGDAQAELAFNGSLTLSPVFPDPFEAFTITWVVCNPGGTASGEFTDVARLDEKTTFERSIPSVPPNGCYERSASHPGLPPGHHYWYVYLDARGDVDEAYEGNNVNYHGFTVPDSRFWINNP